MQLFLPLRGSALGWAQSDLDRLVMRATPLRNILVHSKDSSHNILQPSLLAVRSIGAISPFSVAERLLLRTIGGSVTFPPATLFRPRNVHESQEKRKEALQTDRFISRTHRKSFLVPKREYSQSKSLKSRKQYSFATHTLI